MALLNAAELAMLLERNLPAIDRRNESIEEIGRDSLRMRMPVLNSYLSHDLPPGSGRMLMSGPVMIGFADTAMYACVHAIYGADVFATIVNLNVSFLHTAGADDLSAAVRLLRKGKSLAFIEALLFSGVNEQPCSHVTATYSVRKTGA
jgi:acyl-coenzyme A thioesterase PaaI-like protein